MPDRSRRATGIRVAAVRRAEELAIRVGRALRESRRAAGLTQADAGSRAGVSQSFWSQLERGDGASASLGTLAACAAAVGVQLACFIEAQPGASMPRDMQHLKRQALVIRIAQGGGWTARPERPIDPYASRSRSVDVDLERRRPGVLEIAIVEIEDFMADGGSAMRNLSDKVAAVQRVAPDGRVAGLLLLRATRRNQRLVSELRPLFEARFPASSRQWVVALADPAVPMPIEDGFAWTSVDGTRLIPTRSRPPRPRPARAA